MAVDRHEVPITQLRNILYLNQGDGTFAPMPTTMSGIDNNSIAAVADDLNGDGLLDLVLVALPGNSAGGLVKPAPERFMDTVYYNSGAEGADKNHWLQLRFSRVSHHRLDGARVIARNASGDIVGTRVVSSNHSYKSSNAMRVHFGLGKLEVVSVDVQLPNGGGVASYPELQVNRLWDLDLEDEAASVVYSRPLQVE